MAPLKRRSVFFIGVGLIIVLVVVFAPIIPVETHKTESRSRLLHYEVDSYNHTDGSRFVNLTNTDTIGGNFTVKLTLMEGKPVPGGVEFETKATADFSQFVDVGSTEVFASPKEWIGLDYAFRYTVTPPTLREPVNVVGIEYRSVAWIIGNSLARWQHARMIS